MSKHRTINNERYAAMFKALSNPNRLEIFNILNGCHVTGASCSSEEILSCCVGDLDQQLDIASSTLSHHLKELHRAGLIQMQRAGKQVFCSINPATLCEIENLFASKNHGSTTFDNQDLSHGPETGR